MAAVPTFAIASSLFGIQKASQMILMVEDDLNIPRYDKESFFSQLRWYSLCNSEKYECRLHFCWSRFKITLFIQELMKFTTYFCLWRVQTMKPRFKTYISYLSVYFHFKIAYFWIERAQFVTATLRARIGHFPLLKFWATLPFRILQTLMSICAKFQVVITIWTICLKSTP